MMGMSRGVETKAEREGRVTVTTSMSMNITEVVERVGRAVTHAGEELGLSTICFGGDVVSIADLRSVLSAASEVEDLKHDLDRYMKIANEECNRAEDAIAARSERPAVESDVRPYLLDELRNEAAGIRAGHGCFDAGLLEAAVERLTAIGKLNGEGDDA